MKTKIIKTLLILANIVFLVINFFAYIWPHIECSINQQWKPVIYIYPTENIDVTVKLSKP